MPSWDQGLEPFPVLDRHAQQFGDHQRGQPVGEPVHEFDVPEPVGGGAGLRKTVDQLVGQPPDPRSQPRDTPPGELSRDQAAQPRVLRRIGAEHAAVQHRPLTDERVRDARRLEFHHAVSRILRQAWIDQGGPGVIEPGDQKRLHTGGSHHPRHRTLPPQPLVLRIRIDQDVFLEVRYRHNHSPKK